MSEQKTPDRLSIRIYGGILLVFLVWMAFFDRSNWLDVGRIRKTYHHLEEDRDYYKQQAEVARRQYEELFGNPDSLEKFAREKYYMKKENEDIFIIEKEK